MGFPVGYSDLLFPRFLFLLLSLLGHFRKLIAFVLRAAGLGDLLVDPDDPEPSHDPLLQDRRYYPHQHHHQSQSRAAARVLSLLHVARYGDLSVGGGVGEDSGVPESCAVCLLEFGCEDEVRLLSNCRHVFHRGCIDPWVELDQRTCPLCRAALVPGELPGGTIGASELDWITSHPAGGSGDSSLYPLAFAEQFRFVVSSHPLQPEAFTWSLLSSDSAAEADAAAALETEVWE